MINRRQAPLITTPDTLELRNPEQAALACGAPIFMFEAGNQEVSRIDFVFDAGSWHQSRPLVASFTNKMLQEGTTALTPAQIADRLDYHGAYLQLDCSADYASLSLYCLNKHLDDILPVFLSLMQDPVFPERELSRLAGREKQAYMVNREKVSFQARRHFNRLLFGQDHPYGASADAEDFDFITERADLLKAFFETHYKQAPLCVMISGKDTEGTCDRLMTLCEDWEVSDNPQTAAFFTPKGTGEQRLMIPHPGAIQHAIRVGKTTIGKTHPDYQELKLINTLLGGYFGSRLMANIREDKGYTYGINSSVTTYRHDAVFVVGTEVGAAYSEATVKEILKETGRLCTEPVPTDELNRVAQYLSGVLLSEFDGPFALADRYRDAFVFGLDFDYYRDFFHLLRRAEPLRLMHLAQTYLSPDTLKVVIVG